ncbi:MAG: hypothetical protein ACFE8P_17915 [Promethearchaeota archaeon]
MDVLDRPSTRKKAENSSSSSPTSNVVSRKLSSTFPSARDCYP